MIEHWPFWVSASALASVAVIHWLVLHRMMAVSGRYSALIDLMRGRGPVKAPEMTDAELMAAMSAAVQEEFGDSAMDETARAPVPAPVAAPSVPIAAPVASAQTRGAHVAFLTGTLLGGLTSALLAGAFVIRPGLASEVFHATFGESGIVRAVVLMSGGVMVGVGTRMAGGCTSGHGLCGVSRVQPGSLAATVAFFGTGVVVSLLLGAFS